VESAGISTIYLASPRETCLAELGRMAEGQGRGPASFLPRALHTIVVNDLIVLDLTADDALAAVGLTNDDLAGLWDRCQAVGAAAHFLRLAGIVAPSATGSGIVIAAFESHIGPGQLVLESTEFIDVQELVLALTDKRAGHSAIGHFRSIPGSTGLVPPTTEMVPPRSGPAPIN
jgi:RES domain-containing protein